MPQSLYPQILQNHQQPQPKPEPPPFPSDNLLKAAEPDQRRWTVGWVRGVGMAIPICCMGGNTGRTENLNHFREDGSERYHTMQVGISVVPYPPVWVVNCLVSHSYLGAWTIPSLQSVGRCLPSPSSPCTQLLLDPLVPLGAETGPEIALPHNSHIHDVHRIDLQSQG